MFYRVQMYCCRISKTLLLTCASQSSRLSVYTYVNNTITYKYLDTSASGTQLTSIEKIIVHECALKNKVIYINKILSKIILILPSKQSISNVISVMLLE